MLVTGVNIFIGIVSLAPQLRVRDLIFISFEVLFQFGQR